MKNQFKNKGAFNQAEEKTYQQECIIDETVVLSDSEIGSLLFMIEEEKMAQDVYDALYEQTGLAIFDKISNAETKHMDALLRSAERLDIDTSFLSSETGVFENLEIQDLYTDLLTQASVSTEAALEVGYLIEQTDIEDLQIAIEDNSTAILGVVYNHLLDGSENHLAAFETYM